MKLWVKEGVVEAVKLMEIKILTYNWNYQPLPALINRSVHRLSTSIAPAEIHVACEIVRPGVDKNPTAQGGRVRMIERRARILNSTSFDVKADNYTKGGHHDILCSHPDPSQSRARARARKRRQPVSETIETTW